MGDELITALLQQLDARVVVASSAELSRTARAMGGLSPAAAALLAQGLTATAMIAALQKAPARINLQLECDGPLRGMFCDGSADGTVRGYVKNPHVQFTGLIGEFQWRPALGNKGYLSVLRQLEGGEYYRSAIELEAFELARDLERFFIRSEQLPTRVRIALREEGAEPLGQVAGLLIQPLPGGDLGAIDALVSEIDARGGLAAAFASGGGASAARLLEAVVPRSDVEVMARLPLRFACGCSKERMRDAIAALGRAELEDVLNTRGKAEAVCQFCNTRYELNADELRQLLGAATR